MKDLHPLTVPIKIWGDFACWTDPLQKVERVSYPVPTQSGLNGIVRAIFWKPEVRWIIQRVDILNPISYVTVTQNEVKVIRSDLKPIDVAKERTQRTSLILRNPAYVVYVRPYALAGEPDIKYRNMLQKRVEKGQFYTQPFMGLRDYTAFFSPPTGEEAPISQTLPLGQMVFDKCYAEDRWTTTNVMLRNGTINYDFSDYRKVFSQQCAPTKAL